MEINKNIMRKAQETLERLEDVENPSEEALQLAASALIVMTGGKVLEMMGGEMGRYDGGMRYDGEYRGQSRTRSGRYSSRSRYDGGGYDGGSRYDGGGRGGRYDGMYGDGQEEEEYRRGGRR